MKNMPDLSYPNVLLVLDWLGIWLVTLLVIYLLHGDIFVLVIFIHLAVKLIIWENVKSIP